MTDFLVSLIPIISTSLLISTRPLSTRPVATVPRPVIVNTSSIGIKNGLSFSRSGNGIYVSTAATNFSNSATHFGSPSRALSAEPRITGQLAPSYPYFDNNSRTSISTKSISSGSSTASHLFRNTTIFGTPTWRESKMCSRVCGIGPSVAATTRIAPSI